MHLNRLPSADTKTSSGARVIGAIESHDEQQNGQKVYYVVIERYVSGHGMTYRTQRAYWYPHNETETSTEWTLDYAEGHGDFSGENGRKTAFRDMLIRSGILPGETEPLAAWEKELLGIDETPRVKPGDYDISDGDPDIKTIAHIDLQGDLRLMDTYKLNEDDQNQSIQLILGQTDMLRKVLNGEATPS